MNQGDQPEHLFFVAKGIHHNLPFGVRLWSNGLSIVQHCSMQLYCMILKRMATETKLTLSFTPKSYLKVESMPFN